MNYNCGALSYYRFDIAENNNNMYLCLACIIAILLVLTTPFSLEGSWDLDSSPAALQKLGSLTFQFKRQPTEALALSSQLYVYSCFLAQFNYLVEQDQLRFSFITASLLQQSCPIDPIDSLKALISKVNYFSISYATLTLLDLAQSVTFTLKRQLIPYATILEGMWVMSTPTKRGASLAVIDKSTVLLCANNYGLSYELNLINGTYPMLFMQVTKQNQCVDQEFGNQLSQAVFFLVEENRTQISMRDYNGRYLVTLDRIGSGSSSSQTQSPVNNNSNRAQNNLSTLGQINSGTPGQTSSSNFAQNNSPVGQVGQNSQGSASGSSNFQSAGTTGFLGGTTSSRTDATSNTGFISSATTSTTPSTPSTTSAITSTSPQINQSTQSSLSSHNNQNSPTQQPSSSSTSNQQTSSPAQSTFNSLTINQQASVQPYNFNNNQPSSTSSSQGTSSTNTQSSNFNFFDLSFGSGAFGGAFAFNSLGSTNSFATQPQTSQQGFTSQGNQLSTNQASLASTAVSATEPQPSSATTSHLVTLSGSKNSTTLITLNVPLSEFVLQSKWQITWMKGLTFVPPVLDRSYIIFTTDRLILYCPCNTYYTQYRLRGNLLLGVKWQGTQNQCQNSQDNLLTDLLFYSKIIRQNGQNLAFFFNQQLKMLEFKPFF